MIGGSGNIITSLSGSGSLNIPAPSCGGYPLEAQVESPVVYGNNDEFTGTLVAAVVKTLDVTANDVTPLTGDIITFTRSGTMTPDSWTVDFGDGNIRSSSTTTITHKYRNPGTYTVRVWAGETTEIANIVIKTNYITASEDDLTAYAGVGTLRSWINFQDESRVALNGSGEITGYDDNVVGVDWVIQAGSPTNPPYARGYDEYGVHKYMQPNIDALDGSNNPSGAGKASSDDLVMDDALDAISFDTATEKVHIFLAHKNNVHHINNRFFCAYPGTNYYMRQASYNNFFLQTSAVGTTVIYGTNLYQKWVWNVMEIVFDGTGSVSIYFDGVFSVTKTGITGDFDIAMFGSYVSSQHTPMSLLGFSIFKDVNLTGADLTGVRDYWQNKLPTPMGLTI
jgi:hypothetical protein